ncbi:AAA family ATPase [Rhodobacteraceae bacterium DSL-40]|uniref:ATP-dependent DNA helicase n=1 Tax=Amaricoccus sp. B4 TaxID=3368557 RepID=UPI000DABF5FC
MEFSADQLRAWKRISATLAASGVDLEGRQLTSETRGAQPTLAVIGKAGSGKTMLLAQMVKTLVASGVETISADYESRRSRSRRTLAVLAPTNKAASVLRARGVPATTIHRILYTPLYDPEYEAIAEWLTGKAERPKVESLTDEALDRAEAFYKVHPSVPGALASAGLRGSDFIRGWKRRDEPLDIGMIDEASMLDKRQYEDLRELFSTLVLFGDPAQLAPVGTNDGMVFETLPEEARLPLARVHRQAADSPIIDLAHALADDGMDFDRFEDLVHEMAARDERVVVARRVDSGAMARAPVLVWRNDTRVRLIHAFRLAHGAPPDGMMPGEPLICDGIELPLKHRKRRMDLEARGLVKGAQAVWLGPGKKPGFSRLFLMGSDDPRLAVASIIQIESPGEEEPFIPTAARMGAVFLHGAAVTIHKAQGSQWPEVQLFAPDILAAARSGRVEAGIPLWKRLAYVAITRAEERLFWIMRYALSRPAEPLGIDDLSRIAPPPVLMAETPVE